MSKQGQMTTEQSIKRLKVLMREAVRETQRLDADWNGWNDALNAKYRAEGVTDIVQLTKLKAAHIPLRDALEGGRWWREKAMYLATVIQAELALREAGL